MPPEDRIRVLHDVLSPKPGRLFHAYISGRKYSGKLVYMIDPATGGYELTIVRQGAVGVLNDLHRGRDSGAAWAWVVDLSGAFLTLIALMAVAAPWLGELAGAGATQPGPLLTGVEELDEGEVQDRMRRGSEQRLEEGDHGRRGRIRVAGNSAAVPLRRAQLQQPRGVLGNVSASR